MLMDRSDRVLITGATGFIGGRLVEMLAAQGVRMRIATSDLSHCSRVGRFPVELIKADLVDHAALTRAAEGCNIIFHFGYRFGGTPKEQQRVNLEGTRVLAEALLKNGGRRLVHISSVSAYGAPRDGDLTEDTPPLPTGDAYSNTKQKIERLLLDLHRTHGLPVAIIQPTIVYGPYGSTWTVRLLEQVRSCRIVLPAGGLGLCNAVYVDDVVVASMLAVESAAAVGETFLISGPVPVTWREFYGAYEKMLGKHALLELDDAQTHIEEVRQRNEGLISRQIMVGLSRRPAFRERLLSLPPQSWFLAAGQRLLPNSVQAAIALRYKSLWQSRSDAESVSLPVYLPDPGSRALYSARTYVRADKAAKILSFKPAFDLNNGMALTTEWARWANLAPN
jgi:nucleoside-diphosphate-sugar epimerase